VKKKSKKVVSSKNNINRRINKNRLFYFAVIVLAVIILVVTSVKVVFDFFISDNREIQSKKELDSLELYGYTLDDLDTPLYKTYFDELKDILSEEELNWEGYAETLTKIFVVDFYTLNNKITSSDIGGIEFIHKDMVDNFIMHAGDTMYNHIKNNVYGDRIQELPVVSNVTVGEILSESYTYNDNVYEAYKVSVTWEYEKDLGYDNTGTFYLIKDNNKLNVVQKLGE